MFRYESTSKEGADAGAERLAAEYDVIEESSGRVRAHVVLRILPSGSSMRMAYDVDTVDGGGPDADVAWFVLNNCPIKSLQVMESAGWRTIGERDSK